MGGGLERISATADHTTGSENQVSAVATSDAVDDAILPDLARLTTVWPMLTDDVRQAILRLAEKSVTVQATD